MYTQIHQHYSYIIMIAGTCKDWEQNTFGFREQLLALSKGTLKESWNPNARFVIQLSNLWQTARILTEKLFHNHS